MEALQTKKFAQAINAEEILNYAELKIAQISIDSRSIKEGEVFFALKGDRFDGHEFIADAVKKGAKALVVSEKKDWTKNFTLPIFLVKDTTSALQKLANFNRNRYDIPVIAITGSTGKTTCKDFIASVLKQRYNVLKTQGNFNNQIGLPLTLLNLTAEHDVVVVEMGMRALGEIKELAEIAEPDIGVITNVGTTHIKLLKTKENIAKAKAELIASLPDCGLAILNGDQQRVLKMQELTQADYISYGKKKHNQIRADEVRVIDKGIKFKLYLAGKSNLTIEIPIHGKYNVYNALVAIAVALELKLELKDIQTGFNNLELSAMRNQLIKVADEIRVINDAYNANPTSMRAAVDTLDELKGANKIAVLGDMLELGEIAKREHYKLGEYLVTKTDYLLTIGDLAKEIAQGAKVAGMAEEDIYVFNNKEQVIAELLRLAKSNDTILVKASRGMKLEKIVDALVE